MCLYPRRWDGSRSYWSPAPGRILTLATVGHYNGLSYATNREAVKAGDVQMVSSTVRRHKLDTISAEVLV